jgi:HD-like signal output (HDOD) protein
VAGAGVREINLRVADMSITGKKKAESLEDSSERYWEYVRKVRDLPTIPHVLMKVMTLLESPDASSRDLEKVISLDQSLAAKVIRLANSPFYYSSSDVSSVKSAVVNIGFTAVKNLVMAVSVISMFKKLKVNNRYFSIKEFWKHSVGVGIASRALAGNVKGVDVEDCFCAGILHDIGKLVMNLILPVDFSRVLKKSSAEDIFIRDAEREIFSMDHSQFGEMFARHWNFSEKLTTIIGGHHLHPDNMDEVYLIETSIVKFSDHLIRKMAFGFPGDFLQVPLEEEIENLLGVNEKSLEAFSSQVEKNIEAASEIINLV